jgi:DNA repair protein RadA
MQEIAEKRNCKSEEILKKITFIKATDTDILFEVIERLPITIEAKDIKLICVDSMITPFRAEYIGREMLAPRQQALNRALHKLRVTAQVYNIAVAITNQCVAVPTQEIVHGGFEYKPTGGYILGHVSEPRVWIRRAEKMKRLARVVDSSWLPEREAEFRITEAGVVDV